jgi:feruloyl esterase
MKHCTGGEGAYAIDYLSALEAWVEQDKAPERLIGEHPKDGVIVPYLGVALMLAPDQITLRRPIDVWPRRTFYKGAGDADDPANWEARSP